MAVVYSETSFSIAAIDFGPLSTQFSRGVVTTRPGFDEDLVTLSAVGLAARVKVPGLANAVGVDQYLYNKDIFVFAGPDLQVGPKGVLSGGEVAFFGPGNEQNLPYTIWDISIPATSIMAASKTTATGDDQALFIKLLAEDDLVISQSATAVDKFETFAGDDLVYTNGGNDIALMGAGRDIGIGGGGDDRILGEKGNDVLSGDAGNDTLSGGADRDLLAGGSGKDRLTGGAGADVFFFDGKFGSDRITDFQNGADKIAFLRGASGFDDLTLRQIDRDTVRVTAGKNSILVDGVKVKQLTAADFLFGNATFSMLESRLDQFMKAWDYAG